MNKFLFPSILVIALLFASCGSSGPEGHAMDEMVQTQDGYSIKVIKTESLKEINSYTQAPDGSNYIAAEINVQNNQEEDLKIYARQFYLQSYASEDSTVYDPVTFGKIPDWGISKSIKPSGVLKAWITFEVPLEEEKVQLVYKTDMIGSSELKFNITE